MSLCVILALGACAFAGCASDPPAVLSVASKNLKCPHGELVAAMSRETPKVREYYVACDFMYTRVHCSAERGCYTAPLKPPCFGGGCFKEDPVTLQWELDDHVELVTPLAQAAPR